MHGEEIETRLRAELAKATARRQIALRAGMSEAFACRFAQGSRRLGLHVAADLADALGMELRLVPKRKTGGKRAAEGKGQ